MPPLGPRCPAPSWAAPQRRVFPGSPPDVSQFRCFQTPGSASGGGLGRATGSLPGSLRWGWLSAGPPRHRGSGPDPWPSSLHDLTSGVWPRAPGPGASSFWCLFCFLLLARSLPAPRGSTDGPFLCPVNHRLGADRHQAVLARSFVPSDCVTREEGVVKRLIREETLHPPYGLAAGLRGEGQGQRGVNGWVWGTWGGLCWGMGQVGAGQGKLGAGWPGIVPRPHKVCLLSQESLWVCFRLEAGPAWCWVLARPAPSGVLANMWGH